MGKKHIVQSNGRLTSVAYANIHKLNDHPVKGTCAYCFEKTVFRVIKLNKVNQLACVRCLRSARLYKTEPLKNNRMFFRGKKDAAFKKKRFFVRLKTYFSGNILYYPFGIKRKGKLGKRITALIIKLKGLRNVKS